MGILKRWIFVVCLIVAGIFDAAGNERPNILWLTCEDNNITYIGCYGNEFAITPNIDKLAKEGFRYTRCYSNGAVCSASRSTWITGMISASTGLHNHRSSKRIPDAVTLYPKVLQAAGYHTVNTGKMDYNISNYDKSTWDSGKLDWENLKNNQPFFQVINSTESHESKAMSTIYSTHSPDNVIIPPYHPDVEGVRANYASYYESITRMDAEIGQYLDALEKAGLAENTIVIHNSDHGGPLPRGKRYMYDSGTHCPLIIRIPEKFKHLWPADKPGMTVDRLVSFVDMTSTWIALAGGDIPENYQGRVFLGPDADEEAEYHLSFRGRNDARIENTRALRNKQFLYVKNYIPYVPRGQYLDYQWKIPIQRIWEEYYKAGKANADQSRFFKEKAEHEFYNTDKDPYCLNNLADNPEYHDQVRKFRTVLQKQQREIFDAAFLPESELDRIAASNGITVYEVLRKKDLYNLAEYLPVADVALERNPNNLAVLTGYLANGDVAIRYWGAVGLMMLGTDAAPAKNKLMGLLKDDSHNVRLMAAWAVIKLGVKEPAYACINNMLTSNSYAMLEVLNTIDWMGDAGKPLIPTVEKIEIKDKGLQQLQDMLVNGPPLVVEKDAVKEVAPGWNK